MSKMAFDDLGPEHIDELAGECARLVNEHIGAFVQAQPLWSPIDTMFLTDCILTDMHNANRIVILTMITAERRHGEDENA
jgi:hypothetical protein